MILNFVQYSMCESRIPSLVSGGNYYLQIKLKKNTNTFSLTIILQSRHWLKSVCKLVTLRLCAHTGWS